MYETGVTRQMETSAAGFVSAACSFDALSGFGSKTKPLQLKHLAAVFWLLLIGYALSLTAFLAECIYSQMKLNTNRVVKIQPTQPLRV